MPDRKVTPSDDFTSKVMAGVKRRPRKIGAWNILYFVPAALALIILSIPVTQDTILNLTNSRHTAMTSVRSDLDQMYTIMEDLAESNFEQDLDDIAGQTQSGE